MIDPWRTVADIIAAYAVFGGATTVLEIIFRSYTGGLDAIVAGCFFVVTALFAQMYFQFNESDDGL